MISVSTSKPITHQFISSTERERDESMAMFGKSDYEHILAQTDSLKMNECISHRNFHDHVKPHSKGKQVVNNGVYVIICRTKQISHIHLLERPNILPLSKLYCTLINKKSFKWMLLSSLRIQRFYTNT